MRPTIDSTKENGMKRIYISIFLILALCLIVYGLVPALHRAILSNEAERAVQALADCYRFVFASEMDRDALGLPFITPKSLDEVPGWNEYAEKVADPALRALYRKIDWHQPEDRSEGKEIASIDLPHTRAVVLQGGSAFAVKKGSLIEQSAAVYVAPSAPSPEP